MEAIGDALGVVFLVLTFVVGTAIFFKLNKSGSVMYFGGIKSVFSFWLSCVVGTGVVLGLILVLASGVISVVVGFIAAYYKGIIGIVVVLVALGIYGNKSEQKDSKEEVGEKTNTN